jgi:hypothetical protein
VTGELEAHLQRAEAAVNLGELYGTASYPSHPLSPAGLLVGAGGQQVPRSAVAVAPAPRGMTKPMRFFAPSLARKPGMIVVCCWP